MLRNLLTYLSNVAYFTLLKMYVKHTKKKSVMEKEGQSFLLIISLVFLALLIYSLTMNEQSSTYATCRKNVMNRLKELDKLTIYLLKKKNILMTEKESMIIKLQSFCVM